MSLRVASLRHLARTVPRSTRPLSAARLYATPSNAPNPSRNTPPPSGLESLFGGESKDRKVVAPIPAGVDAPSGPSLPKKPDVGLSGLDGEGKSGREAEVEEESRRPKLSDFQGKAGKKSAMGGGGGSGGGAGGPQGFGGMTPNQMLLAVIRSVRPSPLARYSC